MNALRARWFRGIVLGAIGILLLALAWSYSAREPVLREPNSSWIPLAFSPDGEILAAANSNGHPTWWSHEPGGPIHLLRAADLAPAGPPVETPTIDTDRGAFHPPLEAVEFSPNGEILAVLQTHRDHRQIDLLELHLIRLPEGEVWKSIPISYDRWHKRGGIARRLFSTDGRLLVWHDLSQGGDRRDTVRVWDVTEGRERFAAEGMTYPVLSPDGMVLAAVEPYRQGGIACRLYDTRTGQVLRSLPLPGDDVGWQPWPEFSADGTLLAVNCRSSTGKGPSVSVFGVASGTTVFESPEWSPHFVKGPTLVTVKDDSVLFRATDKWQVRARASFSLGRHWDNGSPISPEPQPVPGRAAVLVYDYYPAGDNLLRRFGSSLRLDTGVGHRASWVDAVSGAVTPFTADNGLGERTVVSPSGTRLVVRGATGITIWDLPPARSWRPTAVVAGLMAFVCLGCTLVRRRIAARVRPLSSDPGEKGSA
jgi:WD40 repeat protein